MIDSLKASFAASAEFLPITGALGLGERFRRLRINYAAKARHVADGIGEWYGDDPYEIADWISLFTPIESAIWSDIRTRSLSLWPQFPVAQFFVDFGNPVAKVAVECDGAQYHDSKKDAARDAILGDIGWKVYRIPGWLCKREILPAHEAVEAGFIAGKEEYEQWRAEKTPAAILTAAAERLEWNRGR